MDNHGKSKEQLIRELEDLRSENTLLKRQAAETNKIEESIPESWIAGVKPTSEQNLLRTLVDMLPSYVYVKDKELRFLLANNACAKFMGVSSSQDLIGKSDADFYPAKTAEAFRSEELGVLEGIPILNKEDVHVVPGRESRILLTTKIPLKDSNGTIVGLLGTSFDISDHKLSEEKLKSSEERLKILFDYAPDAYFLTDLTGKFIDGNIAAEKLFGLKKAELTGKDYTKLIFSSPEQLPLAATLLLKNSHGQATDPDDFILTRDDGSSVTVEIRTYPVKIKDQTLVLVLARDITGRKQTEKVIVENEANLKAIIENTLENIWSIDTNYRIQYVNDVFVKAFKQTFGADLSKGTNILEALPQQLRGIWKERYDRAFKKEHFVFTENIELENTTICIEVAMNPIVVDGEVKGASFYGRDISESSLAEKKILESESQFRSIFEAAADAIFIADAESGLILDANEAASRLMLLPIEKIIGLHQSQLHPSDIEKISKESFLQHKEELINEKQANPIRNWLLRSDGSRLMVEVLASDVTYKGKKCLMGLFRDVTERTKTEELLQQTTLTYQNIFNTLTEAIYILDGAGTFIEVNKGAELMYGYAREELIGQSPQTVAAPGLNNMEEIQQLMEEVFITNIPAHFEFWATRSNGDIFLKDVIVNKGKYFDKDVLIATARDITQRKRDEDSQQVLYEIARASSGISLLEDLFVKVQSELGRVIDTTNFFIALYNSDNDTFHRVLFSDEKDEFVEWKAGDSLSGQVLKSGKTILMNKEEQNRFANENNLELLGTVSESWLGVPLVVNKKAVGVMVVQNYRDPEAYDTRSVRLLELMAHELETVIERTNIINDLIAAKEKAEESERLKSAFLANMSHEIRTPMNGILGFLALLNEPNLEEKTRSEYIDVVRISGDRLLDTINSIIEMSKIESGGSEVRYEDVNIMEIMRFQHSFFKLQTDAKELTLSISEQITGPSAIVKSDRQKIEGTLTNLIRNAIKFTTNGGIEIGNYIEDNSLVFFVRDSGKGIPSNRLEAVFDRFVQADLNISRMHEGSGLGLSIAKGYVEALGGKIWVQSEPGIGSTFSFSIPYKPSIKTAKSVVTSNNKLNKTLKGLTILIAEDDEASYKYLELLLKNEGVSLLHTTTGEDTVNAIKANTAISLVLMDIKMPGMDGYEATSIIKKLRPLIPVIAQTAFAFESDKEKALEAGCIDFISKPVKKGILLDMIKKYI